MEDKKLTGYPSIDKPWMKFYQKDTILSEVPECTVYQNLYNHNKDHLNEIALMYFGKKITFSYVSDSCYFGSKSVFHFLQRQ